MAKILILINLQVSILIQGTRDINPVARQHFCEALGVLGAIDPQFVNVPVQPKITQQNSQELALCLLENFLVKAYCTAADAVAQEEVAFAIQQILKFCTAE